MRWSTTAIRVCRSKKRRGYGLPAGSSDDGRLIRCDAVAQQVTVCSTAGVNPLRAGWEASLEQAAKDDAERAVLRAPLPEGPVVGPDGVGVVVTVGRTAAVGGVPDGGDDPS